MFLLALLFTHINGVLCQKGLLSKESKIVFGHLFTQIRYIEPLFVCYIIIYFCDRTPFVVVCLKQQSIDWAEKQTLLIVMEAETDVEACIKKRTQLLGFAPKAVKHPGHRRMQFLAQVQKHVQGTDTMNDERQSHLFAQADVLQEDILLSLHRRPSQSIQPALTDSNLVRKVWNGE